MIKATTAAACAFGAFAGLAMADQAAAADDARPFGDEPLAQENFAELKAFYRAEGVEATVGAVNRDDGRFRERKTALWMMRVEPEFNQLAHNKLPSLKGVDFRNVQDFQGDYFIQNFLNKIRQKTSATFEPVHSIPNYNSIHHSLCYGERGPRYDQTGIVLGYCYTVAYPADVDSSGSSE